MKFGKNKKNLCTKYNIKNYYIHDSQFLIGGLILDWNFDFGLKMNSTMRISYVKKAV